MLSTLRENSIKTLYFKENNSDLKLPTNYRKLKKIWEDNEEFYW